MRRSQPKMVNADCTQKPQLPGIDLRFVEKGWVVGVRAVGMAVQA